MSFTHRHLIRNASCFCLIVFAALATCSASLLRAESAAAISQGFKTSASNVSPGALMSLQPNKSGAVELANAERVNHLIGIVGDSSLIEFGDGGSEVQVVTSGVTLAL